MAEGPKAKRISNLARQGRGGGERIDVPCFQRSRRRAALESANDLHVCPDCRSDLVHPLDWAQVAPSRWRLVRRCPECEWSGKRVVGQDEIDSYDVELDRGTEAMLDDLKQLSRANMADDVERFAAALAADQLLPEDF